MKYKRLHFLQVFVTNMKQDVTFGIGNIAQIMHLNTKGWRFTTIGHIVKEELK